MFCKSNSLISLNLNYFNTSKVENMQWMFSYLNKIKILDLSNFNTSSIQQMNYMFYGSNTLVSLNLSNFDTSKFESFDSMFRECESLIYLNLNSFIIGQATYTDMYIDSSINYLCYNNDMSSIMNGRENSCNNNCFRNQSKLIINKKTCINECYNDNIHKYEYKNICFNSCLIISQDLYGISDNEIYFNYNKTKCIYKMPDGYYLNDTINKTIDKCNIKCKTCNNERNINNLCLSCNVNNNYFPIDNNISINNSYINCSNSTPLGYIFDNYSLSYNPCYSSCKKCFDIGDNYNHKCLECIDNYYLNDTNCYENCTSYYYFDIYHKYYCTEDNNCPDNKSKLITEKGECIDDCLNNNIYKYEYNNSCFKSCLDILEYLNLNEIYYDYNKTKCIDKIPGGYLNDTNNKIIDKCNIKCKTCDKEGNINDLCLSCNKENFYYPIINKNNSDNNKYVNCYNYAPSGYTFDEQKECYNIISTEMVIAPDNFFLINVKDLFDKNTENDKIIEDINNKLNHSYIDEVELEEIKNGNEM